jgi:hypothetical protein
VQVPPQPAFYEQINLPHRLRHASATLAPQPQSDQQFRQQGYAREELVAEMGSAFLCAALGIVPTVRHADYIASWLEVLREDNRAIFRAASAATKAADWLLTRHAEAGATRTEGGRILLTPDLRFALRAMTSTGAPPREPSSPSRTRLRSSNSSTRWARQHGCSPNLMPMAIPCSAWRIWASAPRNWAVPASEIASVRLPFGMAIERDIAFDEPSAFSLGRMARRAGSILGPKPAALAPRQRASASERTAWRAFRRKPVRCSRKKDGPALTRSV